MFSGLKNSSWTWRESNQNQYASIYQQVTQYTFLYSNEKSNKPNLLYSKTLRNAKL